MQIALDPAGFPARAHEVVVTEPSASLIVAARAKGFKTLAEDGIRLVRGGVTSAFLKSSLSRISPGPATPQRRLAVFTVSPHTSYWYLRCPTTPAMTGPA